MVQPERPRSLVIAYLNSQVAQQLPLLLWLQEQGRFAPTLLFLQQEALKPEFSLRLRRAAIPVIDRRGRTYEETLPPWSPHTPSIPPAPTHSPPSLLRRLLRRTPLPAIVAAVRLVADGMNYGRTLFHLRQQAVQLYKQHRPAIIIMPEENILSQTTVWTRTAEDFDIPIVIIPYTVANATELAESVHKTTFLQLSGFWNCLVARWRPRWVYEYKEKRLLLLPWPRIIVLELMRLVPPDPWMFNSGTASILAVESPSMRQYFLDNGLPEGRLVVTGSVQDDTLGRVRQERAQRLAELRQRYRLSERPILLCALPPPWFPRPECEFPNFQTMVDAWLELLTAQERFQVIIHLHPRLRYEDLRYLEKQFHVAIGRQDIIELIPLADFFVANISATIRWAIACGLPVLNYDVYQWGFRDFDSAGGVVTVNNRQEFQRQLEKISTEPEYFKMLRRRQTAASGQWGFLDEQSGRRILDLFIRLTKRQSNATL